VLSIAKGYDTTYLTDAVSAGREGYYTGAVAAGEPAGLWYGAGADELGLAGEVDAELMEAVYGSLLDPRDPAAHDRARWGEAAPLAAGHRHYRCADDIYTDLREREAGAGPERRAELRAQAERSARQAVSFYDVTFSAPKSVSVVGVAFERMANDARAAGDLAAAEAWGALTKTVEDAVLAGSRAAVDYLQDVAGYSRIGHHGGGAGRWTDAHAFVVAQFLQHDSRDRDPQLHVHQAILNRVRCADGVWRSVDSRALHAHRGAAGAIAERVMEAYLDQAVGVWFEARPDGRAREIVGVSEEMRERFSSRRRAIGPKAEQLTAAFRERYGRDPSPPELRDIFQQATLATRTAKSHQGETHEQRLERWTALAEALKVGGLTQVAHDVLGLVEQRPEVAQWSQRDVIERALARVAESKATWSRSDLMRALSDELPGRLGLEPAEIRSLLEGLTDQALESAVLVSIEESTEDTPGELVLADGRSALSAPGSARYATKGQIVAERMLRAAAVERGAAALSAEVADAVIARFAECGHALGEDQAAAVRGGVDLGCAGRGDYGGGGDGEVVCGGCVGGGMAAVGAAVVRVDHRAERRERPHRRGRHQLQHHPLARRAAAPGRRAPGR
jgi:conjugative relaxase-like TrwC/TraI family protein